MPSILLVFSMKGQKELGEGGFWHSPRPSGASLPVLEVRGREGIPLVCGAISLVGTSTYGLRGSFGFCRLHMQVGHHGLQALFVFCKLMGRKGFVMSLNTDVWLF